MTSRAGLITLTGATFVYVAAETLPIGANGISTARPLLTGR